MVPPSGRSPAEQWVAAGVRAATRDLLRRLASLPLADPILTLDSSGETFEDFAGFGAERIPPAESPFHFGRRLAALVESRGLQSLAYFGGSSAPLLSIDLLSEAFEPVARAREPKAVVNNFHSTDWIVMNQAHALIEVAESLPKDNPLGWVLQHEAGFEVEALPPQAATRSDLDTPTDLMMIRGHQALGPDLSAFLESNPPARTQMIDKVLQVLRSEGKTLTMIGRASSHLYGALEQQTQIWIRAFIEERGMVASGRLSRGEVRSLIGSMADRWDLGPFVEHLTSFCDAVLWDTRVWMAQTGFWPKASDRFAADLGWAEQIEHEPLRTLTQAINRSRVPIVAGGYGVVSGGVYALLERLRNGCDHQPSKKGRQSPLAGKWDP